MLHSPFTHWPETRPAVTSIHRRARAKRRATIWRACGGAALALSVPLALIVLIVGVGP